MAIYLYPRHIHPTQNCMVGERSGSVVECRTPEREVGGRNLPPPCCVIEQDTLLPKSISNTQEALAEKLLTRMVNLNTNKETKLHCQICVNIFTAIYFWSRLY